MKTNANSKTLSLAAAVATAMAIWQLPATAQETDDNDVPAPAAPAEELEIEEVVVLGRFISSSQQLVNERMSDAFATDLLGADTISRLGDSTVAAALRRVPGLTLVQDKFVYIRGLGERYSQTTLNGAFIPSPDLTRNVIPLNVFPTSVVESLRVQKSYSPELSANFGGGAVDIRTKGIPDAFTLRFEAGIGFNSENPSNVLTYNGGGDDSFGTDDGFRELSPIITAGIAEYQGNPSVNQILNFLQRQDPSNDLFDAQTINREFALALNRDVGVRETSADPDYKLRGSVGNSFQFGSDWEAGFALGASYETDWRFRRTRTATFALPEEQNGVREETTRSVNISGTANFGLKFLADHEIETTTLFLRNTDDETEVFDFFNENRPRSSNRGFRDYRLEFEERNMTTNQIRGTHYLGIDTRERLPFVDTLLGWLPEETMIEWFYSDSTAKTDIPNRVIINSDTTFADGEVAGESVRLGSSAADYRFTELDDEVRNHGWSGMLPLEFGSNFLELSGGYDHAKKARTYAQTEISLGYLDVSDLDILSGDLSSVFSDENITTRLPDNPLTAIDESRNYVNNIVFDRQGANTNSYIAATMTDSIWGKFDWTIADTWRIAAGARWEDYRQASVPWNPWGFSEDDPQVRIDADDEDFDPSEIAFNEDEIYPAVALTYMGSFWADTFQLRLGYSETAVRPDLREITFSSYIDPITDTLTQGQPSLRPSEVENIDLRAEWYFANSDTLSITLFQKDITDPIEFVEIPASDTTIARRIQNLESASIQGMEFEFLKELAFLGGFWDTLFVQGNFTYQWEKDLEAGPNGTDLFCAQTDPETPRPECELSGASELVANFMFGYDSRDSKHTASLILNYFDERLFSFGRFGPDAVEQPFTSLDFTYFWYPTDRLTLKAKAQNVLNETVSIERSGVVVFEEDPGTTYSLALQWGF